MQKNQFYGSVGGSIPKVSSGGAPSTTDVYKVEVTKAGPSGTAEITVTNTAGTDNLAANTIATGVAEALGTKSGTFTAVFEYLHLGDFWTIQQYATGEIEEPIAGTGNYRGTVIPISVNESGELVVSAELEVGDIEIGAVELKNAATDDRCLIGDANTARAATDHVLVVQGLDAAGNVLDTASLALESGGNLDTIAGDTTSIDGKITACDTGSLALESGGNLDTIAGDTTSIDGKITACDTGSIAGTVTANAGTGLDQIETKLNTSNGHLSTIAGSVSGTEMQVDVVSSSLDSKIPAPMTAGNAFAQLDAPGSSSSYSCGSVYTVHVLQVVVATINTDVEVFLEGSIDDTDWYTLGNATYTTDGVKHITVSDAGALYTRIRLGSEHGGTDVTIDGTYVGK